MTHPAHLGSDRLLRDCEIRFTRRSGPGGQNRNKVETAVVLTHRPSGTVAEANEKRSQGENREMALFRLRMALALEHREPLEGDSPSNLWQSRCRGGRISVNPRHPDAPALMAEALDTLSASAWDVKAASHRLGCSPSQLVKLLKIEPRALATLNREREERGEGRLL
jgi:hypothetical protein